MGRVRNKTIKKAAKVLIEKYYMKLTPDFHINKKILSEVGEIPSKRLRNQIAGFATHLLKRIQTGPVKGISLKLQEEERERRLDFVPEVSNVNIDRVEVNKEAMKMLTKCGMQGIKVSELPEEKTQEENKQSAPQGRRNQRAQ